MSDILLLLYTYYYVVFISLGQDNQVKSISLFNKKHNPKNILHSYIIITHMPYPLFSILWKNVPPIASIDGILMFAEHVLIFRVKVLNTEDDIGISW